MELCVYTLEESRRSDPSKLVEFSRLKTSEFSKAIHVPLSETSTSTIKTIWVSALRGLDVEQTIVYNNIRQGILRIVLNNNHLSSACADIFIRFNGTCMEALMVERGEGGASAAVELPWELFTPMDDSTAEKALLDRLTEKSDDPQKLIIQHLHHTLSQSRKALELVYSIGHPRTGNENRKATEADSVVAMSHDQVRSTLSELQPILTRQQDTTKSSENQQRCALEQQFLTEQEEVTRFSKEKILLKECFADRAEIRSDLFAAELSTKLQSLHEEHLIGVEALTRKEILLSASKMVITQEEAKRNEIQRQESAAFDEIWALDSRKVAAENRELKKQMQQLQANMVNQQAALLQQVLRQLTQTPRVDSAPDEQQQEFTFSDDLIQRSLAAAARGEVASTFGTTSTTSGGDLDEVAATLRNDNEA